MKHININNMYLPCTQSMNKERYTYQHDFTAMLFRIFANSFKIESYLKKTNIKIPLIFFQPNGEWCSACNSQEHEPGFLAEPFCPLIPFNDH